MSPLASMAVVVTALFVLHGGVLLIFRRDSSYVSQYLLVMTSTSLALVSGIMATVLLEFGEIYLSLLLIPTVFSVHGFYSVAGAVREESNEDNTS